MTIERELRKIRETLEKTNRILLALVFGPKCPHCGQPNNIDNKVCDGCGKNLSRRALREVC